LQIFGSIIIGNADKYYQAVPDFPNDFSVYVDLSIRYTLEQGFHVSPSPTKHRNIHTEQAGTPVLLIY
jgi:hypothetical protein